MGVFNNTFYRLCVLWVCAMKKLFLKIYTEIFALINTCYRSENLFRKNSGTDFFQCILRDLKPHFLKKTSVRLLLFFWWYELQEAVVLLVFVPLFIFINYKDYVNLIGLEQYVEIRNEYFIKKRIKLISKWFLPFQFSKSFRVI